MKGDNSKVSLAPDTPVKPMIQPGNLVHEAASDNSLTNPKEATTEFTATMDCLENNMSFCDVMALADAAGAKTASGSNTISGTIPVAQFDHCNKQTKQGNEKANQDKVVGVVQQREQSSDVGSEQAPKESKSGHVNNASLGTSTPAQQKPRRKYMPKVVKEGQTKRTRNVKAQQSVRSNDVQTPQRRSVRRKGTSIPPSAHFVDLTKTEEDSPSKNSTRNIQPSTPLVDLASSKPKTDGLPRNSSKRSLNFDTCFQVGKESSSCSHASEFHLKSQAQSSYTEIQSSTQLGHGQGTVEKGQAEHIAEVQRGSTRGKCQIVFSDTNHSKEYVAAQIIDITSTPAPGNPNDFKCSPSNISSKCIPLAAPSFQSMLATGKETRKRSRGTTRSNIASRNEAVSAIVQEDGNFNQDNRAAKRTKKQHKINTPSDSYPGALSSLDALVEQLRHLDIDADRKQDSNTNTSAQNYDGARYQEQNAVVVYQRDGTLVTAKKQPPRARVALDEETIRVSKLLQEDINSEGINGTTKEKVEWWKEERRIFGERANSFIRCMHLIQGDRTFSRWKGSVVDSVVGVFLTQNVGDHLSSSAYMSLAARFPPALKSSSCKPSEIGGSISSVQHPEMAETTKHNIEVAILPGMNMGGKEVCREESGSSREIASQGVNIEPQPQTSSRYLKNDFDVSRNKGMDSSPNNIDSLSFTNTEGKTYRANSGRNGKGKSPAVDWDSLRKQAHANGEREQTMNTLDSADWEAVRLANVEDIAHTIKERGMNNVLAERIKEFLDRLISDHGNIDLEWLRDIPPDKAKKYLRSINGLGMKSVECVRLLTLHHIAFPVDTNVGRIAVRLGWVPLQPLPESLQLHLLELYPLLESVQQYLWPRLCKLDQKTLYELHYQMITFGKVFCTKNKPNCNACPLRGECRHFASAFASARLALPAPKEGTKETSEDNADNQKPVGNIKRLQLPASLGDQVQGANQQIRPCEPIIEVPESPEPTIEVPETPELERTQGLEDDIEDFFIDDPEDIPTIQLNIEEFTQNLQDYIQSNKELQECNVSKALVALTPEAASIPTVKLKNSSQLRTEHLVYVLPDTHPLLEGLDRRDSDDPFHYLLAIWTPGETADSIHPPAGPCRNQQSGSLCSDATCFACSCTKEAQSQTIRGTLLIPCRTAMRGSFPLNGTYFQVNEVFADHASSLRPLQVPRSLVWNLPRKKVHFGTSVTSIFRGMATEEIQMCFWKGYVCVRGFDRERRAPRPLLARLHFPPSKLSRGKEKKDFEE